MNKTIAVIIPTFKVKKHILKVIGQIPAYVDHILVVDDCCPEYSGEYVLSHCKDPRVQVLKNDINLGVGGAVCHGYKKSLEMKIDIMVKVDGDDQMDPNLIESLIQPLLHEEADYVKGSRFHKPSSLAQMPTVRLIGNTGLSFINKIVTGYWDIMDPTNGFTAISYEALAEIPLEKISPRYFFEGDMLFRLSLAKARVLDFPMEAKYADEVSNLRISRVLVGFPPRYIKRFLKRIFYQYFLRDFNFGSLSLICGAPLFFSGILFGVIKYYEYAILRNQPAPTGMVVIPSLLITLGTQFLISFFQFDINSNPQESITSKKLRFQIRR
ncbi:MAG: glycosyltransferase family 2 protein [Bacteriovoracaceae bacterium]